MAKEFRTLAELNTYLQTQIMPDILLKVAKEVKYILSEYIREKLYSDYSPVEYQRTGDFLESLDVRAIGNDSVEIFFNTDRIRSNDVENSWNQHMSWDGSEIWNGKSVPEWMPYFIEFGTHNSLWDMTGIHSMETIKKQLEVTQFHIKEIVKMLKAKGINAKIG